MVWGSLSYNQINMVQATFLYENKKCKESALLRLSNRGGRVGWGWGLTAYILTEII